MTKKFNQIQFNIKILMMAVMKHKINDSIYILLGLTL